MDRFIQLIQDTQLFNTLHKEEFYTLAKKATIISYQPDEWIIREGDVGNEFFIILEGTCRVIGQTLEGDVVLARLGEGRYFGEQALLHAGVTERNASVQACTHTRLLKINKQDFQEALTHSKSMRELLLHKGQKQLRERMTSQSRLLRSLKFTDRLSWQKTFHFSPGEVIYRTGDTAEYFFLIALGTVELYKEKNRGPKLLARLGRGQCFGELALLEKRPRSSTAIAETNVELMGIEREQFASLYQRSPELREYLQTLQKAYALSNQGFVTQHSGLFMGFESTTNFFHLDDGRTAVSSYVIDQNLFNIHFTETDDDDDDIEPVRVRYQDPSKQIDREITLLDSKITGMTIQGPWDELGRVKRKMMNSSIITQRELEQFQKTGKLLDLIRTTFANNEVLCHCLQIRRGTLRDLIREGHTSYSELSNQTGAGTVCGSCSIQLKGLLGRADWTTVKITEEIQQTKDIRSFRFDPGKVPLKPFQPGQHIALQARINGRWIQRPYTLTSPHNETAYREITVKAIPGGFFSNWLFDSRKHPLFKDVLLQISEPQGNCCIQLENPDLIIYFAAGIGITPALCFARSLQQHPFHRPLRIEYSISSPNDDAFVQELQQIAASDPAIDVHVRITSNEGRLTPKEIQQIAKDNPQAAFYTCGPLPYQHMVESNLTKANILPSKIFVENFTPNKNTDQPDNQESNRLYIWLGLTLLAMFLLQATLGLKWTWLQSLQQGESYQRWSGVLLLGYLIIQWILPAMRLAGRFRESTRFYMSHKTLGACAPLLFYFHSTHFGHAFLGVLSSVFFANTLLGLTNKDLVESFSENFKAHFTSFWLIGHISLSVITVALLAVHILLVFGYQ